MFERLGVVRDIFRLLIAKKKYWLLPLIIMLLLLGLIVFLGSATPLGPLIYPFI